MSGIYADGIIRFHRLPGVPIGRFRRSVRRYLRGLRNVHPLPIDGNAYRNRTRNRRKK